MDCPGQTGRLRRGNRLDQARIVIPDIAAAHAHRPANPVDIIASETYSHMIVLSRL
jgi:hypothetical protein